MQTHGSFLFLSLYDALNALIRPRDEYRALEKKSINSTVKSAAMVKVLLFFECEKVAD
jgi:hypothetical protein